MVARVRHIGNQKMEEGTREKRRRRKNEEEEERRKRRSIFIVDGKYIGKKKAIQVKHVSSKSIFTEQYFVRNGLAVSDTSPLYQS